MIAQPMTFSPASERNKAPILEVLRTVLPATGVVLEIDFPLVVDRFVAEINGFLERKKGICEDPQH